MFRKRLVSAAAIATAATMVLAGCGGGGEEEPPAGGGSAATVDSLTVLDYYTDEPGHTNVGDQLTECGTSIGVRQDRPSVGARSDADPEGAPAGVVEDAARRADARQPRHPADRRDRRAGSAGRLRDHRRRVRAGPGVGGDVRRASCTACSPGANTIAIFYNKDVLDKAGVKPPTTWAELKSTAKKLTVGKQYGFAFNATADYEGAWQFLPPMWTNGGDETSPDQPRGGRGAAAVEGPGRRRLGVQERGQLERSPT